VGLLSRMHSSPWVSMAPGREIITSATRNQGPIR
jgi:hypothetical protein